MTKVFRDRYGAPAKLDDSATHGRGSGAELFVVEGDSAASAVARVRDPLHQAVLPMQGKPLNAARAPRAKVESHPFFGPLAAALGVGFEATCDPRRLRYDRVLVLTDPDADGIHCGYLVLLFFHRWMRPLLDAGRIEVVRPPWGEVVVSGEIERDDGSPLPWPRGGRSGDAPRDLRGDRHAANGPSVVCGCGVDDRGDRRT